MKKFKLIGLFVVLAAMLSVFFAFTSISASANDAATTVEQDARITTPNTVRDGRTAIAPGTTNTTTTPGAANTTAPGTADTTPTTRFDNRGTAGTTGTTGIAGTANNTGIAGTTGNTGITGTANNTGIAGTTGIGNTGNGTPLNDYNAYPSTTNYNNYNNYNNRRYDNTYNRGMQGMNQGVTHGAQNYNQGTTGTQTYNQSAIGTQNYTQGTTGAGTQNYNQGADMNTGRRNRQAPQIQTVPFEEGCIIILTYQQGGTTANNGTVGNDTITMPETGINTMNNTGVDTYGARANNGGMNNGVSGYNHNHTHGYTRSATPYNHTTPNTFGTTNNAGTYGTTNNTTTYSATNPVK